MPAALCCIPGDGEVIDQISTVDSITDREAFSKPVEVVVPDISRRCPTSDPTQARGTSTELTVQRAGFDREHLLAEIGADIDPLVAARAEPLAEPTKVFEDATNGVRVHRKQQAMAARDDAVGGLADRRAGRRTCQANRRVNPNNLCCGHSNHDDSGDHQLADDGWSRRG